MNGDVPGAVRAGDVIVSGRVLANPSRDQPTNSIHQEQRKKRRSDDLGALREQRPHGHVRVNHRHNEQLLATCVVLCALQGHIGDIELLTCHLLAHFEPFIGSYPGRDIAGAV